MNHAKVAR